MRSLPSVPPLTTRRGPWKSTAIARSPRLHCSEVSPCPTASPYRRTNTTRAGVHPRGSTRRTPPSPASRDESAWVSGRGWRRKRNLRRSEENRSRPPSRFRRRLGKKLEICSPHSPEERRETVSLSSPTSSTARTRARARASTRGAAATKTPREPAEGTRRKKRKRNRRRRRSLTVCEFHVVVAPVVCPTRGSHACTDRSPPPHHATRPPPARAATDATARGASNDCANLPSSASQHLSA